MLAGRAALLTAILWLAGPSSALADTGTAAVRIRYSLARGAEQCPDVSAIREAVAARLGYVPWREEAKRTVVVAVSRAGAGLRARVELRDESGKLAGLRELSSEDPDCKPLAAAVELAISIAIDPLSFARVVRPAQPAGPPRQGHDVEPIPEQLIVLKPGPRAPAQPKRKLGLSASVGGLVAFGSAPAVAGGITFQGRLHYRFFSAALEGRIDFPAYLDVPGGQISSSLFLGSVLGCAHWKWLQGCAQVSAGGLRAAGHHIADAQSLTLPYVAIGVRLAGEVPIFSVLALRFHADLLGALSRITLAATDTRAEIWSTPPVSGALGMAVVGKFL